MVLTPTSYNIVISCVLSHSFYYPHFLRFVNIKDLSVTHGFSVLSGSHMTVFFETLGKIALGGETGKS